MRQAGSTFEYRAPGASHATPPVWSFEFSARHIHLRSNFPGSGTLPPLVLNFDPYLNHATLLGIINEDSTVRLPAILHLPDLGTFRITSPTSRAQLWVSTRDDYTDAGRRRRMPANYIRITFPAASLRCVQLITIWKSLPFIPKSQGSRATSDLTASDATG